MEIDQPAVEHKRVVGRASGESGEWRVPGVRDGDVKWQHTGGLVIWFEDGRGH